MKKYADNNLFGHTEHDNKGNHVIVKCADCKRPLVTMSKYEWSRWQAGADIMDHEWINCCGQHRVFPQPRDIINGAV